ncbi:MAG: hypothetical protein J6R66_05980 [Clostridia bacterium]|nr:hypothetical protein [Clostridia bacterium]
MAEVVVKPKAFTKEWFGYVWDYYKWHIIVGIVAVILAVITIVQICTTVKYDTNINFVATTVVTTENAEEIAAKCAENSSDLNNNGKVDIAFNQLNFTEENRENGEMHSALLNKLMALFSSGDELIFVVDSYMLEQITRISYTEDIFVPSSEWADEAGIKEGVYAVSLADSTAFKESGVDSSDMYVMVARMDYEDGLKPAEENAIAIANFLIK